MDCQEKIYSEEYADFIGNRSVIEANYQTECKQRLGPLFAALYLNLPDGYGDGTVYGYYNIPKLYGLQDTGSMEASGILQVRENPELGLDGSGILIGFVDTGIDYAGSIFRNPDGTTRVVAIWDQTIPSGTPIMERMVRRETQQEGQQEGQQEEQQNDQFVNTHSPADFEYGSEFTQDQLNDAIRTGTAYAAIPSRDENGHGTFLASIAAGNELVDGTFTGAAPKADIAMVKLKPAKNSLRAYYQIKDNAIAYQENDIMAGVSYLVALARKRQQPLVICLGIGTNCGSHSGGLPLARLLDTLGSSVGVTIVAGTGNETARGHHFEGHILSENAYEDVEIRVAEGENGFLLELWAMAPETYSVAVRSPNGETIPRIFVRPGRIELLNFALAQTQVEVSYRLSVTGTGEYLALLRFMNITPGVWTIRVYNDLFVTGSYHMWLPIEPFLQLDTVFLRPSEFITLTSPSDASNLISVSNYNDRTNSIYLYSGRGYTTDVRIRPDLAAPGVEIEGFTSSLSGVGDELRRVQRSGSSIAAAHTAGAAALFYQWTRENGVRYFSSADVKTYFIRGANRDRSRTYPNREWGFGTLDLYGVFRNLQTQAF